MSVTLCVHTAVPSWTRAVAGVTRNAVDEIVVAVDSRVDEDELGELEAVADRLLRYEYADPPERVIAWLAAQCNGDWLLRLDHDEVPSRRLLDELARLTADPVLTQYWVPRRWAYPTVETYLDEPPWSPNHEPRLVRNDRRFVRFPGVLHVPVEVDGPGAWIDAAIYHFDLLVNDQETRRRKAERWERVRPGMRLLGRAVNEVVYLPELRPGRALSVVPQDDVDILRAVTEPTPPTPKRPAREIPLARRDEIDALWPARPLPESAYRARIALETPVAPIAAGEQKLLEARVRNEGSERWPWRGLPEIQLSYHWLATDGAEVEFNGLRTPLPHDLAPGEELLMPLTVEAPAEPGDYLLQPELVHEHHRWFGDGPRIETHVAHARTIALVAFGDPTERIVELSFERPECEVVVIQRPATWQKLVSTTWAARAALGHSEALLVDGKPERRLDRAFAAATQLVRRLSR